MAIGIGSNKPRLGIPKVNANPRPPSLKAGLANRMAAPKAQSGFHGPTQAKAFGTAIAAANPTAPGSTSGASAGLTQLAQGANSITTLGRGPELKAATPAPAAPPSTDPFATPTFAGDPAHDPRDSTYWTNLAKLQFNDRQEYGKNQEEQTKSDSDYNAALQTAIRNRAVQERQLGENSISHNLSASGWLNRTQGEQTTAYTSERAGASLSKEQEDHARASARQALVEGYGIDTAAEMAAAGGRYAKALKEEAENGGPEAGPAAGPGPAAAPGLPASAAPGAQMARGFSNVGVSNNQALGNQAQYAKAFAAALKKGKK